MDKMVGGIPPKRVAESPKMAAPEIPKNPETVQPLFDKGELATGTKSLFGAPSQERLVKAKPKAKPVAAPKSIVEGIEDELSDHSKNRKSLPGQKHIGGEEAIHRSDVIKQNIESIAKEHKVKPDVAEKALNDAHALRSQHWEHENSVIKDAMKRLGKGRNAGFLSLHENQHGKDYSKIRGFDEIAQEVALAHPHMGWDPHDTDTSKKLWDLIRKTRTPQPQLHDEDAAKQASQMLTPTLKKPAKKEESLFNPAEFDGPDEFAMEPKAASQSGIKPVGFVNHGHNDKSIKNIQSRIDAHKGKLSKVDADIAHIEKSGSKAGLDSLKKSKEKFLDDINQEEKRLYHVQREIHANTASHPLEKYASSARIDAEQRAENGVKGALSESQIAKNMHTHMEEEIAKRHPELSSEAKAEAAKLASSSLARTPMDGIDSAIKKAVDSVAQKAEPAKVAAPVASNAKAESAPVKKKIKQVSFLGSPGAESITHKLANSVMDQQAKNGFVSGGSEFTGKYTNLSDKDKMLVIKGLASRGLVSQSMARKRTPPVGREVFDEVSAMSKKIVEDHKMVATNRHIPVQESTDYSRAIDGPPPSTEPSPSQINKLFKRGGPEQPAGEPIITHPQKPTDLISLIRQVESGADNGALISSRELRKHAGMGKEEFDNHVLKLAAEGKLMLHRHDYPAGLTDKELAELVKGKEGQHFVGMALSRNQPEPEKYTTRLIPKAGKPTTDRGIDKK